MRITYLKDDWRYQVGQKDEAGHRPGLQQQLLSSAHLFYTSAEMGKFKRQHLKDIEKLQCVIDGNRDNVILRHGFNGESASTFGQRQRRPRNSKKIQIARVEYETNKFSQDSQSTLTTKTPKTMQRQPKTINTPSKFLHVKSHNAMIFARKDSQIQYTDDEISLDCTTSSSSLQTPQASLSQNQMNFLKERQLQSESEEDPCPDSVFRKIKIAEFLVNQKLFN